MSAPPSRYVQPELSEARVERLWSRVETRLSRSPPARLWPWVVLMSALAGAAAGGWFWLGSARSASPVLASDRALLEGAKFETKSDELSVTLEDGSSVRLASRSEVRVQGSRASTIALSLSHGEVACDVRHREGRTFTVVAGDVEVRVVGTRFSVKRTTGPAARVEVSVARGLVEVRSARQPGVVAKVAAGQNWMERTADTASPAELAPPASAAVPVDALEPHVREPAPPNQPVPHEPVPLPSAPVVTGARELFERAAESRRAGDAAGAARAYEELLRAHPSDARASLAAFELGRLRMDRLGDRAGAVAALERAVAMQVGPTFREDALARLVTVYASQGNFGACRRARDRYLSSYPDGVHAAAVTTRCGSGGD